MEVLKEASLKEIRDFFKKTFEQMDISEHNTVDISEWNTVADDKCIRLIGTLTIKEDYLYKTYGKLIKCKKYEVLVECREISTEYQLADKFLEKVTIEGTLGGSLVVSCWKCSLDENDENSGYNLYPHGNKEELNILIPETEKILDTILEKWLLYKMEYVYGIKRNTNYD
ncbi:hypothetical protein MaMV-DH010157 [Cyanophage MaMV-DH01]|nr:hypothetical protein MaMV-DH010157 [Cyanophage MaMV-DH01]